MLIFAPPENQDKIRDALKDLLYVPFKFENAGSQIIVYNPQMGTDIGVDFEGDKSLGNPMS